MSKFTQEIARVGLDWDDSPRIDVRKGRGHVPLWALDEDKMRQVIAARICWIAGVSNIPTTLADLQKLEARYVETMRGLNHPGVDKHIAMVERFGGPASFYAALCYRRFRLHEDSIELGEQFGCEPALLRQHVRKLCELARRLFPDAALHAPCWKAKDQAIIPWKVFKRGRPITFNIQGQRFGRLVALEVVEKRKYGTMWLCQCDCGKQKAVLSHNLRRRNIKSCGCLHSELTREQMLKRHALRRSEKCLSKD